MQTNTYGDTQSAIPDGLFAGTVGPSSRIFLALSYLSSPFVYPRPNGLAERAKLQQYW